MSKPDHDDYVREYFDNLTADDIRNELTDIYNNDPVCELIAKNLNSDSIDARVAIADIVTGYIKSNLDQNADDHARDRLFYRVRESL